MKKRMFALLLAVVLLVTGMPGTSAAGLICFVGVNDSIPISLPAEAAPYYSGGVLYIPYTAFEAGPNGVVISNNVDKNTLVLFTRSSRLVYDLEAGTVADEKENVSNVTVSYRSGILFIPAMQAASHFGLSVDLLTSETGCPIIRFTNGQQVYSNEKFVEKSENLISYFLAHTAKQEEEAQKAEQEQEQEGEVPEEDLGPATVYLAIAGDAVCQSSLEYLEQMNLKAAFFLTEAQFKTERDLVRQIYAAGHSVGLAVDADAADPIQALKDTNNAMDQVLFCRSAMALVPDERLETTAYRLFSEVNLAMDVTSILEQEELVPRLLVCRADLVVTLAPLIASGAVFLQLLETTQFI